MCSSFGARAGQIGRQYTRVLVTAMKNRPSKRASRERRARSHVRRLRSTALASIARSGRRRWSESDIITAALRIGDSPTLQLTSFLVVISWDHRSQRSAAALEKAHSDHALTAPGNNELVAAGRCMHGRHYGESSIDVSEYDATAGGNPGRCHVQRYVASSFGRTVYFPHPGATATLGPPIWSNDADPRRLSHRYQPAPRAK
jgi:hypothetical protein